MVLSTPLRVRLSPDRERTSAHGEASVSGIPQPTLRMRSIFAVEIRLYLDDLGLLLQELLGIGLVELHLGLVERRYMSASKAFHIEIGCLGP